MKKLIIALAILAPIAVFAAPTSTLVQNLFITQLAGNGTKCLQITNAGLVQTSTSACGSGVGGGSGGVQTTTQVYAAGLAFFQDANTISATSSFYIATSGTFFFNVNGYVSSTALRTASGTIQNLTDFNGNKYSTSTATDTYVCTAIVATSTATGQFTNIQTAINSVSSTGGSVCIKDGAYTLGSTLTIPSDVKLIGAGNGTQLKCAGGSVSPCVQTNSGASRIIVRDLQIFQSSAGNSGTGIDISDTSNVYLQNIKVQNFATGTKMYDSTNNTFYDHLENMQYFDDDNCIDIGGTLANANTITAMRCRPTAGNGGTGVRIVNAQGLTFDGVTDIEPSAPAGITGLFIDETSLGININSPWIEGNATNAVIMGGAANISFKGGFITGGTTGAYVEATATVAFYNTQITGNTNNIIDKGSLSIYQNTGATNIGIGVGTSSVAYPNITIGFTSSDGTRNQLVLDNFGNFAGAGSAILFKNDGGGFNTGRITSLQGSSGANSTMNFWVADASKVLQNRLTIQVNGEASSTFRSSSSSIQNLFDFGGNKYVTSTVSGNTGLQSSTVVAANLVGFFQDSNTISATSSLYIATTGTMFFNVNGVVSSSQLRAVSSTLGNLTLGTLDGNLYAVGGVVGASSTNIPNSATAPITLSAGGVIACATCITALKTTGVLTSTVVAANLLSFYQDANTISATSSIYIATTGTMFFNVAGFVSSTQLRTASATIQNLSDFNGNKFVTSTVSGNTGVQTTSVVAAGLVPFFQDANTLSATSSFQFASTTGVGMQALLQLFGIVSSTELRSPSGTITTLIATNVSTSQVTASSYGTFPTLGFTSASGTQISVSGYGTFPTLGFTSASGTQISVSGYGTFPTLGFTNASGTNETLSGMLNVNQTSSIFAHLAVGPSTIPNATQALRVVENSSDDVNTHTSLGTVTGYTGTNMTSSNAYTGLTAIIQNSSSGILTNAAAVQGNVSFLANTHGTIVNGYGFLATAPTFGGTSTLTNVTGFRVNNIGSASSQIAIGVDIAGLTNATTSNIGLRIAAPSGGATTNAALQLSDATNVAAGGILFGTDTLLFRSAAGVLTISTSVVASNVSSSNVSSTNIDNTGYVMVTGSSTLLGQLMVGTSSASTTSLFTLGTSTVVLNISSQGKIQINSSTPNPVPTLDVSGPGGTAGKIWTNIAGSARNTNYDLSALRIGAGGSIYSYGAICTSNNSSDCSGTSGTVLGNTNTTAVNNIPNSAAVFFNTKFAFGINTSSPAASFDLVGVSSTAITNFWTASSGLAFSIDKTGGLFASSTATFQSTVKAYAGLQVLGALTDYNGNKYVTSTSGGVAFEAHLYPSNAAFPNGNYAFTTRYTGSFSMPMIQFQPSTSSWAEWPVMVNATTSAATSCFLTGSIITTSTGAISTSTGFTAYAMTFNASTSLDSNITSFVLGNVTTTFATSSPGLTSSTPMQVWSISSGTAQFVQGQQTIVRLARLGSATGADSSTIAVSVPGDIDLICK